MRKCIICGEELTLAEQKHFNSGLGPIEPWCVLCIKDEDRRMRAEEHIGYCRYRTLPRYLVRQDEWEDTDEI